MTRLASFALVVALAAPALTPGADAPGSPRKPNVVVVLSDDMGFSDLGCYGGEINTPNLDALAAGGLRFTQFYNTARCCPTRASLLTGLYPHQAGIGHMMEDRGTAGYRGNLNSRCATIAEALKPAGYRTYAVGKWHVTRHNGPDGPKHNWPLQRGFDRYYGTIHGAGSYYDPATLTRDNTAISPFADPAYQPERYYYTDAIGEHAVRFIADHQKDHATQPFFLYVAFTAAHWPMHAPEEDIARYKGQYDGGYEPARRARYERAKKLGLIDAKWELSPTAGDWDAVADKTWDARGMEVYAAMVSAMDRNVGRIVAELKRAGRLDDTLVLFLQDNGGCAEPMGRTPQRNHPNIPRPDQPTLPPVKADALLPPGSVPPQTRDGYPVRMGPKVTPGPADTYVAYGRGWANVSDTPFREYKHWVHEGGISTPLIAHWPSHIQAKGELRHQPGHLIDVMATCLDVAGAKFPAGRTPPEGISLVPAFDGKPLKREAIYWEHEGNRAVRQGKWKLVAKGPGGAWELYDIDADRTELHNLAGREPERVKAMAGMWEAWAKRANVLPWPWQPQYGEAKAAAGTRRPNVLLVIADDMGWGDVHSHGNDKIDTPTLDKLAGQGARFDRFFVSPVCAPTRASLLTGRYHLRTGVHGVTRNYETMRTDEVTLAQLMKAAGYATGCFGKWHNGAHYPQHPNGKGFDEFLGFCAGHWNNYFDTTLEKNGQLCPTKGFITDVLTDAALDFIGRNRDRPFFCYVPYNAPHNPSQAPDALYEKYKARGLVPHVACVYAMVENLDTNLARLLARLDELKLTDDTIVIFLTDNGPNGDRYNGGMKGRKGAPHEGGIRVPLFIRWPGRVRVGMEVTAIAAHIDLLPTLAEWCDLGTPPNPLDGRSLAPFTDGRQYEWPDERMIFTHVNMTPQAGGAVRTPQWRAVSRGGRWELYDLPNDPGQTTDLAAKHPDVLKRLREAFLASHKDVTQAGFDPVPADLGHAAWLVVTLPAHEAILHPASGPNPGIAYKGERGYANDWIAGWSSPAAYPEWDVAVVRPGRYEIALLYCCPVSTVGSRVRVEVGGRSVEGTIGTAHDPTPLPSPDRVPRGEVYEKVWAPLVLGAVELPVGRAQLAVKAVAVAGKSVCDLKAVRVRKVD